MTRPLYCRHNDCDHVHPSIAGDRPRLCPGCGRTALWSATPLTPAPAQTRLPGDPKKRYVLSKTDCRFLKSLRIDPEMPPVEEDDGA